MDLIWAVLAFVWVALLVGGAFGYGRWLEKQEDQPPNKVSGLS